MAIADSAEEYFRQAAELLNKMPDTKERNDLLCRIIIFCLKLAGHKDGESLTINIPKGKV